MRKKVVQEIRHTTLRADLQVEAAGVKLGLRQDQEAPEEPLIGGRKGTKATALPSPMAQNRLQEDQTQGQMSCGVSLLSWQTLIDGRKGTKVTALPTPVAQHRLQEDCQSTRQSRQLSRNLPRHRHEGVARVPSPVYV